MSCTNMELCSHMMVCSTASLIIMAKESSWEFPSLFVTHL